jgi:V/A-type H+-transporting ATPase subunit E
MVTIEEKIRLITELVYQKIEKENKEEIERFNERFKNLIEEKKRDFEEEFNRVREERIKKANEEAQRIVSKAKYEEKRILLKKRDEVFNKFFEDLKIKLEEYTKSNQYKDWLLDSLKKALENKNFKLILTNKDFELLKPYLNGFKVEFDDSLIGGFILEDENRIRIDHSLKALMEDKKEKIGQILFSNL